MGTVYVFITLQQQALFAPTPEWEQAAAEALALVQARHNAGPMMDEGGDVASFVPAIHGPEHP